MTSTNTSTNTSTSTSTTKLYGDPDLKVITITKEHSSITCMYFVYNRDRACSVWYTGISNSRYWIHRESAVINNSMNSMNSMNKITPTTQLCTAFNCPMFKVTERSTILLY